MVRFQQDALIIEIPCNAGEAVEFYELLQGALCGVNWLVTAYGESDILYVGRELGFFGLHLGPALAKLEPSAKKAIMGQVEGPSELQLPYEVWKERHFAGMPDIWTMRFWLTYQKENNGPFAHVEPTIQKNANLENLSFSAVHRAFPEISASELTCLLQTLNEMTLGTYSSFADLHKQFSGLSEERLRELLTMLGRVQEQEDHRRSGSGSAKDEVIEAIIQKLDQLDHSQLKQVTNLLTRL